jgi:hypothetical protein
MFDRAFPIPHRAVCDVVSATGAIILLFAQMASASESREFGREKQLALSDTAPLDHLAQAVTPPAPKSDTPEPSSNAKEPKEGTPATVVDVQQLESVLGISVLGSDGDDMGRIVDIIVDRSGQVRATIIDFGGFLGVGSRKIAVDWGAIRFLPNGKADTVAVHLTKDQLRVAPVYKPGEPVVVVGRSEAKP